MERKDVELSVDNAFTIEKYKMTYDGSCIPFETSSTGSRKICLSVDYHQLRIEIGEDLNKLGRKMVLR